MFLKRLEINGFKSFAQKTVFDFGSGISGIVGPNGSGKSNVIDAIRWLLGEREAKNLRGAKSEDLIFAGSAKKAKLSQAQVSLVFDNTQGKLPVDFKEVIITRKISRNGDSEYLINDAVVRLKDIIDFFSKIKLGTKGLTVIGQGSGDIFVRATPQERMMMVQEILGLREYQLKKAESQRKLKNTKINLEKIQAMIQEVTPRLRMLKRQTARWEKREELEQRLRVLEMDIYATKLHFLFKEAYEIERPIPQLEETIRALRAQEHSAQEALQQLEKKSLSANAVRAIQEKKKKIFDQKSELERKLYRLEAELTQHETYAPSDGVSFAQAKVALEDVRKTLAYALQQNDLAVIREALGALQKRIEDLYASSENKHLANDAQRTQKQGEYQKLAQDIGLLEKEILAIEKEEQELSKEFESFNERFKEAYDQLESVRNKIRLAHDQLEKIMFAREKNQYKLEELKSAIMATGADYQQYVVRAKDASYQPINEQDLAYREHESMKIRGELAAMGEIDEALIKEAHEVEQHHAHLTKEYADLEHAYNDLVALIKELNQKITQEFHESFKKVNDEFNNFFRLMFGGGFGKMKVEKKEKRTAFINENEEPASKTPQISPEEDDGDENAGIYIELSIPQKKITSLEMLSGGEKSLVSLAVLFALISVSPPPFLVLDEVDSALDEKNSRRFSELIQTFAEHTQFIVVTHNRITMEAANVLYGVTMDEGGGSKVLSLKMV